MLIVFSKGLEELGLRARTLRGACRIRANASTGAIRRWMLHYVRDAPLCEDASRCARGLAAGAGGTEERDPGDPHLLKLEGLKRTVKSFCRKLSQATSALLG